MHILEPSHLEYLADDVELHRAAAKTLKGFCLTYLPHHFPADLSDFFDEMAEAPQDHDIKRRIDRTRAAHTALIDSRAVEKLNFRILLTRGSKT